MKRSDWVSEKREDDSNDDHIERDLAATSRRKGRNGRTTTIIYTTNIGVVEVIMNFVRLYSVTTSSFDEIS